MASKLTGVFPLKGVIQDYAWGGKTFLSDLFNVENKEGKPFAEYWVGVHPRGIAQIETGGTWENLDAYCQLPFLLKILDVNQMLSIQSHPNKGQAEIGFAKENEEGIPLDAKHRIFKDDNHKPELMVAMGDFWLLHGFKSTDDIKSTIASIPEFKGLIAELEKGVKEFYTYLLNLSEDQLTGMLTPLQGRLAKQNPQNKNNPDYWANLAFNDYGFDKGIFSIYFFNLVYLKEGEAIYQEAGIPHAYLEGKNIEIMANSDNVFRAGLTPKHVDAAVLLAHLDFNAVIPKVISPVSITTNEQVYKSPAEEFEVRLIEISESDYSIKTIADECFIVLSGKTTVVSDNRIQFYTQGDCIYTTVGQEMIFKSALSAKIVRATLPR